MPTTIVDPQARDEPILGLSFAIQLGDEIKGWFTECSGLSVQREIKSQPEGGVNDYVHQLPGRIKHTNITLKNGLAGNELWAWFQEGLYDAKVERRNVSIILYNADLKKKKSWDLVNAYPVKWTGPGFNSANSTLAVETLELVHHGLTMNDWLDT
jgi:phage tail-like protein